MKKLENVEQYKEIIQNKVVLLFSADWCPDCRFIEPFLPEIEETYNEFTFYYVDRDQFIDLCVELDVFGIPSFVAYADGNELGRFVSKDRKTQDEIEQFLNGL
ncbi:thioredoxin family protein [Bacillus sp. BGMRC 2118]|nr:thioredoxin family protein [Bacillus sp. BGMRC 2118]